QTIPELTPAFLALLAQVYRGDKTFEPALSEGLRSQAMNDEVLGDEKMAPEGARGLRGAGGIRPPAAAVGKLLAASDGARVAAIDIGGWDTHAQQNQRLAQMLKALGEGLAGPRDSPGPAWSRAVVVF